jgi:polysaccharide export outer membrane protein
MSTTRKLRFMLFILSIWSFFAACTSSKKVIYFNNIQDTVLTQQPYDFEPVIQKGDLLNITVSSVNPEASVFFNTPNLITSPAAINSGSTNNSGNPGTSQPIMGYLVNPDGEIKFPQIGNIKADGLSRKLLEEKITKELTDKKLLVDPIVTVRSLNFKVTVLGEVNKPTTINVANEKISILEALGLAGDLTIYGKRENVLLIREEGGKKLIHRIDLNSEKILTSPYYYLKSNDVVYVEPNRARIANSSRTQQLLPIVLASLSFIAIIATYYKK